MKINGCWRINRNIVEYSRGEAQDKREIDCKDLQETGDKLSNGMTGGLAGVRMFSVFILDFDIVFDQQVVVFLWNFCCQVNWWLWGSEVGVSMAQEEVFIPF